MLEAAAELANAMLQAADAHWYMDGSDFEIDGLPAWQESNVDTAWLQPRGNGAACK